jgi:hypothetical protein
VSPELDQVAPIQVDNLEHFTTKLMQAWWKML